MQLEFPIVVNDATVSAVTVRRPTGSDMIAIGDHLPVLMALAGDGDKATALTSDVFRAMVAVAGALTGLGDDAGKLDFADLQSVVTEGMSALGESPASAGDLPAGAN